MLHLGIEVRDFDLERIGFSLSVLDPARRSQTSESYLRMTLTELSAFIKAMQAAHDEIELVSFQSSEIQHGAPPQKGANIREVRLEEAEAAG